MEYKTPIFEGFYRITPLGEHTTFECEIHYASVGAEYGQEFGLTNSQGTLIVSYDTLLRMKPQFVRKFNEKEEAHNLGTTDLLGWSKLSCEGS